MEYQLIHSSGKLNGIFYDGIIIYNLVPTTTGGGGGSENRRFKKVLPQDRE